MGARHRVLVVGSCLSAMLACMCGGFSASDPGNAASDSGATGADATVGNDGNGDSSPSDAGVDARCTHAFCADFDDLKPSDPPHTGWTEAVRDTLGSSATLIQSEVRSPPNAARFEIPNAAETFFVFKHTEDAGAPVREASLTFSMRPKISEIPDGGHPGYTIGAVKLLNDKGDEVGSVTLDWNTTEATLFGWVGGGASLNGAWKRQAGTLAIDEWLVVTVTADVANKTARCKIRDAQGVVLGGTDLGGRDWPEIRSVAIEIGPWGSDKVRPALTLTIDDVFLDVTR